MIAVLSVPTLGAFGCAVLAALREDDRPTGVVVDRDADDVAVALGRGGRG